jgi:glycosyltransferase involved in cell wall biosynthesis
MAVIPINFLVICNIDLNQKWGDYTRIFSIMKDLKKQGHEIIMFIIRPDIKKPRITHLIENDIEVIEIHPPNFGFSGKKGISRHLNYLACIPTISNEASKIISKKNIDYIYSYMPGTGSSVPAMRIKSKHGIPLILDLADMYSYIRPKIILKKSFKSSDKILVITDYLKQKLLDQNIPENKIILVPNGVDLELFDPDKYNSNEIKNIRSSFNADQIIVFSGSLQDLNILIDSAEIVIHSFPKIKFIIIGDHRDKNRSKTVWERIVKEKNLKNYFIFLGKQPKSEIPKYILCADICVDTFPDEPYFAAAAPVKLLEYGACGKPVVATAVSETEKIVIHKKFGLLAKPSDYNEYAQNIINLLSSDELRNKMGNDFAKYIKSEYNWEKLVQNLESNL